MKKNTPKAGQQQEQAAALPAGFVQVDTELDAYESHNFDVRPVLQGTVVKVKAATVHRKGEDHDTKLAVVDVGEDEPVILWMSANLEGFFEQIGAGSEIYVRYDGMANLGKGKTMRKFTAAVKG